MTGFLLIFGYCILTVITAAFFYAKDVKSHGRENADEFTPVYVIVGFFWFIVVPTTLFVLSIKGVARLIERWV